MQKSHLPMQQHRSAKLKLSETQTQPCSTQTEACRETRGGREPSSLLLWRMEKVHEDELTGKRVAVQHWLFQAGSRSKGLPL